MEKLSVVYETFFGSSGLTTVEVLNKFLRENTTGAECVVEFGSMFFEQLRQTRAKRKIGIEVFEPYIHDATFHTCIKVHGDFREYDELISSEDMDVAMFIDSIEHVEKDEAVALLHRVQRDFKKILVFVPEGVNEQTTDRTGYGNSYQNHLSSWSAHDFAELGFQEIEVVPNFHPNGVGVIFAVWELS
jgi:hypothetical protein